MEFRIVTRAGLSQQQFAELVGVTRVTVNTWFTGRHRPSPYYRQRVQAALKAIQSMVKDKQLPIDKDILTVVMHDKLRHIRARIDREAAAQFTEA